jgi:endonuclease YncB( thermonuclease family)
LGKHGEARGSVAQQVHDGDTIIVEAAGNLSIRFLGIDTPEVSFTLSQSDQFFSIGGERWEQFLNNPFEGATIEFVESLGRGLKQHLDAVTGSGCAQNHAKHAKSAHNKLEELIEHDMQTLGQDRNTFEFFMAFSHEIMDRYGRLLCFINRNQESANDPEPRPKSYNERMLELGLACPYFIWPNINPFRREPSIANAIPLPGRLFDIANSDDALGLARQWVRNARQNQNGLFEPNEPLRLEPFELRFLSRQQAPDRWVMDLSNVTTNTLIHPTRYYTIPHSEDRLFVPSHYVPLFVEKGWQRQSI